MGLSRTVLVNTYLMPSMEMKRKSRKILFISLRNGKLNRRRKKIFDSLEVKRGEIHSSLFVNTFSLNLCNLIISNGLTVSKKNIIMRALKT